MSEPAPGLRRSSPALGFIFITLFLDVLGFGLLIPVAPKLVEQLWAGDASKVDAGGAMAVGLLATTYAVMLFFFAPVLGALSDRVGRRPVILVALVGSGLDYLAMAAAPSLWVLFVTRAINGVSGANISACNAYVADVTPPEKRAAAFGITGAAFGLGFVIGPVIGGFLGEVNIRYPFYAAAGMTLLNALYGFFVLPESLPAERRSRVTIEKINPVAVFAGLGKNPLVAWMGLALFFANLAQLGLHATWVLYTMHRYRWTPQDVGLSLMTVGISAAIVQGGLARVIIPKLGERNSMVMGLLVSVVAFAGYGLATHGWMIYAIIAVASIGGVAMPATQAIITKSVSAQEQGRVQGALTGVQSVATIFGPIIGTSAFAMTINHGERWGLPAGLPFFVGAGLSVFATIIAARATRER